MVRQPCHNIIDPLLERPLTQLLMFNPADWSCIDSAAGVESVRRVAGHRGPLLRPSPNGR